MVQGVKPIAKKPDDLSSMSGTEQTQPKKSRKLPSDFCMTHLCINAIN